MTIPPNLHKLPMKEIAKLAKVHGREKVIQAVMDAHRELRRKK